MNGRKRIGRFFWHRTAAIGVALWASLLFLGPAGAQMSGTHYISDGGPTGELALGYRMRTKDRNWLQPVRFELPKGAKIAIASADGFLANEGSPGLFALRPGEVYRLKITEIPYAPSAELFPTLELLNRLWPPAGKELDFPVQVILTQEDLELAVGGSMVTRVVYLERSLDAMPVDSSLPEGRILFDVPLGVSPLAVAETRGKVMAILRLGSRLPENGPNETDPFYFGLPAFGLPTAPAAEPLAVPLPADAAGTTP